MLMKTFLRSYVKSYKFNDIDISKNRRSINILPDSPKDEVFDYVIVGGGSAGCVLAHYLTLAQQKVALIEYGQNFHRNLIKSKYIEIPLCLGYNMHDPYINYMYHTVPQVHMNNRKLFCPRGKTLGGSSSINGMVYVRGHPMDYDRWASEGAEGWDYAHVLPYFMKVENCKFDIDTKYRGTSGPLGLTRADKDLNKLAETFFEACATSGIPKTEDFNGYSQYDRYDRTIDDGIRNDTYRAFLKNLNLSKPNLKIFSNRKALKIKFEGNTATGVVVRDKSFALWENFIQATKEVILCSGAIDSPKMLMLSGIGDGKHLESNDIDLVHHLPGVGMNLQDHLEFYIQHKTNSNETLHDLSISYKAKILAILQYFMNHTGPLSGSHLDAGAFLYSHSDISHPDVQVHLFPYAVIEHALKMPPYPMFQFHIGTLRAYSKGSIKLQSNFHNTDPLIDFNYLSDERDLNDLVKCLDMGREILSQPAFKAISLEEISPGSHFKSEAEKIAFVRYNAESAYHPSCTCKIGKDSDPMAVLDSQLRVRGVKNLRVVDASSFPSITSGNLNAPVIMLAAKAADMILGNPPLQPINVDFK